MQSFHILPEWLNEHNITKPHIALNCRDMLPYADILPIRYIDIVRGEMHMRIPCKIRKFHGVHRINIKAMDRVCLHNLNVTIYPKELNDNVCFVHEEFIFYDFLHLQRKREKLIKKYESHPLFQEQVINELINLEFQNGVSHCKCSSSIKLC